MRTKQNRATCNLSYSSKSLDLSAFNNYQKRFLGNIEFKNVKFHYPSRPKDRVFKGLNLSIKPNKITAIVGHSGAGKSTLAKLISRLYDPTSGDIYVDGHNLKSLNIEHFRSKIAVVDQSPELFNRTLAENIGYGAVGEYNDEMLENAGKIANCGFISKFREGFYTFAGYGGSDLSGGQLQRIAIARAAIRDPKILILDEATSSLDAENEKEVQEALEKLMKGRTVIVIAHRLSTIRNADTIVCMKEGNVIEEGTHDDLMVKKGAYHNLISQQIIESKKKKEESKDEDKEDEKSISNGENDDCSSIAGSGDVSDEKKEEDVKDQDDESDEVVSYKEDGNDDEEEKKLDGDGSYGNNESVEEKLIVNEESVIDNKISDEKEEGSKFDNALVEMETMT